MWVREDQILRDIGGRKQDAISLHALRAEFAEFMHKTDDFADFMYMVVKLAVVLYLVLLVVTLK